MSPTVRPPRPPAAPRRRRAGRGGAPPQGEVSYYVPAPRRRRWPWGLAYTLWMVVGLAAAVAWGVYRYSQGLLDEVSPNTAQVRAARGVLSASTGSTTTFLVLGSSRRPDQAPWNGNSDTMILVRLDPARDLVSMMSIPRDLKVQMPGYSGYQKIDAALSEGGPQLSIRVVKQVIGVPVNHYVLMFWQGFFDLVQHVHGVYEQIDRRYYNPVGDSWTPIDLQPGYQLLNGNQALEYVRFRHLDTDIVRESRQQKFILAFRRQASGQIGPTDIPSILDTIAGNLQTDVHSASTIIDLGRFLLGLPKGRIVHTTLDVTLGPSYVYTTPQMIHRSVERFLNPVLAPAPGAPTAPAGSDIGRRVVVENAGDGFRAADRVVAALRSRGIVATSAGNAPAGTLPASVVYYAPGDARIARRLAAVVGLHDVRPASPGALVHVPMALVLGPGFPASHPFPAHRTEHHRTHAAAAAAVVRDAAPARAAAQLRGVGLRVEAPTVRSPLSRLAPLTPVRAYRIAKRGGGGSWPALNVSFEDGPSVLGRFWDVEETTMPDPPIMDDATGGLRRGGRSYRIVYDGGHVYVVGFHEHGAWYWVTNTLDDSLTAGQMLRIAEGVRPVRHA